MKKCVFTYIFGKNQELLREPLFIDKDIEYICVTDQKDLKSKTWKIIYEPLFDIKSLRDKVALTKFNPFKYTDADKILIQDSSLQIKNSINSIFDDLDNADILLKRHPLSSNLKIELNQWVNIRNMPEFFIKKFELLSNKDNLLLENIPVFECCLLCIKNDKLTKDIFNSLLALMKLLGDGENMIMTQQCPFAYLINSYYNNLKIKLINQHKYFIRYNHNSYKRNYS